MATDAKVQKLNNSEKNYNDIIEQIDEVQNEIDRLNEQASNEILQVERTFNQKRQPFYQTRNELIANVPNFWLATFKNHPQLSAYITAHDEAVLKHLNNIDIQEFGDIKSGYKINFNFSQNEYFTNTSITKEFHIAEPEPYSKTEPVNWHNGKNFTTSLSASSNSLGKRPARPISVIQWLVSDTDTEEISDVIKDDLWPNPLQYYLSGEIDEEDNDEEDLGEEDTENSLDGEAKENEDEEAIDDQDEGTNGD